MNRLIFVNLLFPFAFPFSAAAFHDSPFVRIDYTRIDRPTGPGKIRIPSALMTDVRPSGSFDHVVSVEIAPDSSVRVTVEGPILGDTGGVEGVQTSDARFPNLEAYNHAISSEPKLSISNEDLSRLRQQSRKIGLSSQNSEYHSDLAEMNISTALISEIVGRGILPINADLHSILANTIELQPDGKVAVHISGAVFGDTGGTGGVFEKSLQLDSLEQFNQLQNGKGNPLRQEDFQRTTLSFWKDAVWINYGFTMKTQSEVNKEDCATFL